MVHQRTAREEANRPVSITPTRSHSLLSIWTSYDKKKKENVNIMNKRREGGEEML